MKKDKVCTHPNTLQVGTDTVVEIWCTDCNDVISTQIISKRSVVSETINLGFFELPGLKNKI